MPSNFAHTIRNARKAAGLTQVQLGTRLGLKGRAVYRWERGESSPTRRHRAELLKIIQALNPRAASALEPFIARRSDSVEPSANVASALVSSPPTHAAVEPIAALDGAIYRAADQLDVPARHLRTALVRVFARLRDANLTLEAAAQLLERRIAEPLSEVDGRDSAHPQGALAAPHRSGPE